MNRYAIYLFIWMLPFSFAHAQVTDPPSGTGTSIDPYLISNLNELWTVSSNPQVYGLNKYYKQTTDIDASSTSGWNLGAGFSPIGNASTAFTGQYDGSGRTITGLTIARSTTDNVGLFGYTNGATITNLKLVNVSITGEDKVGALVGTATNGTTISKSSSSGTVHGTRSTVGGLVGENQNSYVSTSYSSATVSATAVDPGNSSAGGLVGWNNGGTVARSYATGNVTGETAGGLVGLILYVNSTLNGSITDSYATGLASGTVFHGGLVGENRNGSSPVTTSYFNTTTGGPNNSIGTGLTTEQMRLTASFTGFDFTTDWQQINGVHFPVLIDNTSSSFPGMIAFAGGSGTVGDPYQIATAIQLHAVRANVNASYILTSDIDLSTSSGTAGGEFWNSGAGFEPIGPTFYGNFNGAGYTINGLFINRTGNAGLFRGIGFWSTVSNIKLTNVNVTGTIYAGGVAGSQEGTVIGAYVSGTVTASHSAGGISGFMSKSVSKSFSSADVSGETNAGGISGYVSGPNAASITNSVSTGAISGGYTGGITGQLANSTKTVSTSFATGTVTSIYVNGAGGVVGYNGGVITNSYWNKETSNKQVGVGNGSTSGTTGLTSLQMRNASSFAGFDFVSNWTNNAPGAFPTPQGLDISPLPGKILLESLGSAQFTGVDDDISLANNGIFNGLSAFTIEFWMKSTSNSQKIVVQKSKAKNDGTMSSGWQVLLDDALVVNIHTGSGTMSLTSNSNPTLSVWHHVAARYDGTNLSLFVDGEDVSGISSGSASGATTTNTEVLSIGGATDTKYDNFAGNLSELRIWNDVRSVEEIKNYMFQSLTGAESGLIGYWRLNKLDGNSFTDKTANANHTSNNGTVITADVPPTGTYLNGNEGWRILSVPSTTASVGTLLESLWTQGFTGADYEGGSSNVYTWNESTQSFQSVSNADIVPDAGAGLLVYVFDDQNYDQTPDGFPKRLAVEQTTRVGEVVPDLSYTDTGNSSVDGWNLIGNPYNSAISWDGPQGFSRNNLDNTFYVWNSAANGGEGAYLSWNGTTGTLANGTIAPWQGFWVKANAASPSMVLSDSIRTGAGVLQKSALPSEIRLSIAAQSYNSDAILAFSDEALFGKDEKDAFKLAPLRRDVMSLFTLLEDGSGLDINVLPFEITEPFTIPLMMTGEELTGEITLSWIPTNLPEEIQVVLKDTETQTEIKLNEMSSYQFEIVESAAQKEAEIPAPVPPIMAPQTRKASDSLTRFVLVVSPATSTNTENRVDLPTKLNLKQNFPNPFNPTTTIAFEIPKQAKVSLIVTDLLGRQVANLVDAPLQAGSYSYSFDASHLASGLYFYRLQVASTVITKKMLLIK